MNNSNDWYNEDDIKLMFACKLQKARSLCKNSRKMNLSNRILYFREDVNKILLSIVPTEVAKVALGFIKNYNVDFDSFITIKDAIIESGISRQRIYQLKDSGSINTTVYNGRLLFNRNDLVYRDRRKRNCN